MHRCIALALKGKQFVSPNPMVGAVVVHKDIIIGEGYHQLYGEAHAEVNAINAVEDKSLLADSILYVSLEPCAHHGKTPPCVDIIIKHKIPKVVVGCIDAYSKVAGKGIEILKNAGVEVVMSELEEACFKLNKHFFTAQLYNRPYIYLKWAQSSDGFIDKKRTSPNVKPYQFSNDFTQVLNHKLRSEVDAIIVGRNTMSLDNPSLTTRTWYGKSPIRILIGTKIDLNNNVAFLDGTTPTIIVTDDVNAERLKSSLSGFKNITILSVPYSNGRIDLFYLMTLLEQYKIQSLIVEGGTTLLQSFINENLWDEAIVEVASVRLNNGVEAPIINKAPISVKKWSTSLQYLYNNFHV